MSKRHHEEARDERGGGGERVSVRSPPDEAVSPFRKRVEEFLERIFHELTPENGYLDGSPKLNQERDRVDVKSPGLEARVVKGDMLPEVEANQKEIMFATAAGTVTDMQLGPDGWMYMCSYRDGVVYVLKRR